jgi:hypothetical protein
MAPKIKWAFFWYSSTSQTRAVDIVTSRDLHRSHLAQARTETRHLDRGHPTSERGPATPHPGQSHLAQAGSAHWRDLLFASQSSKNLVTDCRKGYEADTVTINPGRRRHENSGTISGTPRRFVAYQPARFATLEIERFSARGPETQKPPLRWLFSFP